MKILSDKCNISLINHLQYYILNFSNIAFTILTGIVVIYTMYYSHIIIIEYIK